MRELSNLSKCLYFVKNLKYGLRENLTFLLIKTWKNK